MIRFRRLRFLCLLALVLPVLAQRALIPAGFMAAAVDGTVQMVLCQPGAMAGHHHHHPVSPDPSCPYAQGAGPALMSALPVLPKVAMMHRLETPPAATQTRATFGPLRQNFPRGPPTLA